jgi:hypothetical protein
MPNLFDRSTELVAKSRGKFLSRQWVRADRHCMWAGKVFVKI